MIVCIKQRRTLDDPLFENSNIRLVHSNKQ